MNLSISIKCLVAIFGFALLSGCANQGKYDYSSFRESRPSSILVLPPLNNSPDVKATYSMLSHVTLPLAESGYYVVPVTLMDEAFRQNGLSTPDDIHSVNPKKLREIFGTDAAMYINVKQYGTSYMIIASETRVTAEGKLIDLRTGNTLWVGSATASSNEGNSNNNGVLGALVSALINQIGDTLSNRSHAIASITGQRLLSAGRPNGILYGPRSPLYLKEGVPTP